MNTQIKINNRPTLLSYIPDQIIYLYNILNQWLNDQKEGNHDLNNLPCAIIYNFIKIEYVDQASLKKTSKETLYIKLSCFYDNQFIFKTDFTQKTGDAIRLIILTDNNNKQLEKPYYMNISCSNVPLIYHSLQNKYLLLLSFAIIQYTYCMAIVFNYYEYIIPSYLICERFKRDVCKFLCSANNISVKYITYLNDDKYTSTPYVYHGTNIPIPSFILNLYDDQIKNAMKKRKLNQDPCKELDLPIIPSTVSSSMELIDYENKEEKQDDHSYNVSQINYDLPIDTTDYTNAQENYDELINELTVEEANELLVVLEEKEENEKENKVNINEENLFEIDF